MTCGGCSRELDIGEWPFCPHGRIQPRDAQVHSRERAVIYRGPNGERITPPRADLPMPSRYIRQGFVREDILSMSKYERESGVVHESSNFRPGNEPDSFREPTPPKAPKALRESLIDDIRSAAASGPWTTSERDQPKVFGIDAPIS